MKNNEIMGEMETKLREDKEGKRSTTKYIYILSQSLPVYYAQFTILDIIKDHVYVMTCLILY